MKKLLRSCQKCCIKRNITLAISIISLLYTPTLIGLSATWSGIPGAAWLLTTNWIPMTIPDGPADIATFALGSTDSVGVGAPITLNGIIFSNPAITTTIAGASLAFAGTAPSIISTPGVTGGGTFVIPLDFPGSSTTTVDLMDPGFVVTVGGGSLTTGDATAIVDKLGPGVFTISSDHFGFTGSFLVSAGFATFTEPGPTLLAAASVVVQGGTLVLVDGGFSISPVTMTSGSITLGDGTSIFGSFAFRGGAVVPGGASGEIDLPALSGTVLTMEGGVDLPSIVGLVGGDVLFDSVSNGTATISGPLLMGTGGSTHTFDIGNGTATVDMEISSVISETAATVGIMKTGAGTLELSGAAANTYTGTTTVTAGTLSLNKTAGMLAVPALLTSTGGTIALQADSQIPITTALSISGGGNLELNGNSQTMSSLTITDGSDTTSGGTLTLTSIGTALTMRNQSLGFTVALTGASGGSIAFDATDNGTATIASVNLGAAGVDRVFSVAEGTATNDMVLLGGSSTGGGGFDKQNTGRLRLLGTHTYPGAANTVTTGTLAVDGTLTTGSFTVDAGALLMGTGTITGIGRIDGNFRPGSSIGTMTLIGDQTFGTGSAIEIEATPTTADLIDITGSLTIEPGVTLQLIHLALPFPSSFSIPIITTTTGITGSFTTITSTLPLLTGALTQTPTQILLQILATDFTGSFTTGPCTKNAESVAAYLDSLNPADGSDLSNVLTVFRGLATNSQEIIDGLDQLQNNFYKGFITAQETNSYNMNTVFTNRSVVFLQGNCFDREPFSVWIDAYFDHIEQGREKCDIGFRTNTGGAAIGLDWRSNANWLVGGGLAYSYSDIDWREKRADGAIQNGYASFYATWFPNPLYVNVSAMGVFNSYRGNRRIKLFTISRHATQSHYGAQALARADLGAILSYAGVGITPSASVIYLYTHERAFQEHGATSLNLKTDSEHYEMLRTEAGFKLSKCRKKETYNILFNAELFYIRESRFHTDSYTEKLVDSGSSNKFKVKGPYPSRNLIAPGFSITGSSNKSGTSFTAEYKGEFTYNFQDHLINFQLDFPF